MVKAKKETVQKADKVESPEKFIVNRCEFYGPVQRVNSFSTANSELTKFTVLVEESFKKNNGDEGVSKFFADCEKWGPCANLQEGDVVRVIGSAATDSWEDKNTGQRRFKTKFKVFSVKVEDQEDSDDGELPF